MSIISHLLAGVEIIFEDYWSNVLARLILVGHFSEMTGHGMFTIKLNFYNFIIIFFNGRIHVTEKYYEIDNT